VTAITGPTLAILERELLKLVRQRGRLFSSMVRPMLWLLVIGAGFEAMQMKSGQADYRTFLVPGVLGMTLLFGAMLAALATVYDKESGVMRMLVIAPVRRFWIVFARALGAALAALVQALMLLALLALLGYVSAQLSVPLLALALLGAAFACASLGMLVAAWSRTLDNFASMMNLVIFPVFFLSGSLYPIRDLPGWLRVAASFNPYTYAVDLLKHSQVAGPTVVADYSVGVDAAVLIGFSLAALAVAAARLSRAEVHESLVHRLAGGRDA
jgi:ABC-2 type transport system permease protein